MYQLFLMERWNKSQAEEMEFVASVARAYGEEYGLCLDGITVENMCKTPKGKPYFKDSDIYFSISHSKGLFAILVGKGPCGVDLQVATDCNYEKIAKRFFKERESRFVQIWGEYGFFRLWTMREAFGKCTGQGFYGEHPSYITEEDKYLEISICQGKPYKLTSIDMGEDIFCTCCTTNMDEINVVFLN